MAAATWINTPPGLQAVVVNANLPLEWAATQRQDAGYPVEWAATEIANANLPFEWLASFGRGLQTTWDPNNTSGLNTLSNGNLTVTSSAAAWESTISTGLGKISGKWYFRVKINLAGTDFGGVAWCLNTEPTNNLLGNDPNGWLGYQNVGGGGSIWHNGGTIATTYPTLIASGDWEVRVYDADNAAIYFTTMTAAGVLNTNWNNTGANPSTNTGGIPVTPGMALQPGVSFLSPGDSAVLDTITVINDPTLSGFLPYDLGGIVSGVPFETLLAQRFDGGLPLEWLGAIGVIANFNLPLEWSAGQMVNVGSPIDWIAFRLQDAGFLIESPSSQRSDASLLVEALLAQRSDVALPTEWSSASAAVSGLLSEWLSSQSSSAAGLLEALAGQRSDGGLPIEWAGRVGVLADANLPLDWFSVNRGDAPALLESFASQTLSHVAPFELLTLARVDLSVLIESLASLAANGVSPLDMSVVLLADAPAALLEVLHAATVNCGLPGEWVQSVAAVSPVMADWIAALLVDRGLPGEMLSTTGIAAQSVVLLEFPASGLVSAALPVELYLRQRQDLLLPTEIVSNLTLVIGDASLPVEWLASKSGDAANLVEFIATALLVEDTGLPLETIMSLQALPGMTATASVRNRIVLANGRSRIATASVRNRIVTALQQLMARWPQ